jgi:hypothetical protein
MLQVEDLLCVLLLDLAAERIAAEFSGIIRYLRGDHPTTSTRMEQNTGKARTFSVQRVFFS